MLPEGRIHGVGFNHLWRESYLAAVEVYEIPLRLRRSFSVGARDDKIGRGWIGKEQSTRPHPARPNPRQRSAQTIVNFIQHFKHDVTLVPRHAYDVDYRSIYA